MYLTGKKDHASRLVVLKSTWNMIFFDSIWLLMTHNSIWKYGIKIVCLSTSAARQVPICVMGTFSTRVLCMRSKALIL